MRKMVSIGVGAASAVMVLGTAAGVASASSAHQAASFKAAAQSVNQHITRAQAKKIAEAKVPNSKAIEVESDDLHDAPVWKVTLVVKHGRVIVDVNKRTGKATIIEHRKHGDDGQRGDRRDRDEQRAGDDRRAGDERHGNDDRHGQDERHGNNERHGHDDQRGHDRHDRDDHRGHDEHDG